MGERERNCGSYPVNQKFGPREKKNEIRSMSSSPIEKFFSLRPKHLQHLYVCFPSPSHPNVDRTQCVCVREREKRWVVKY